MSAISRKMVPSTVAAGYVPRSGLLVFYGGSLRIGDGVTAASALPVFGNSAAIKVNVLGDSLSANGAADSLASLQSINPNIAETVYAIGGEDVAGGLNRISGLLTPVTATAGELIVRAKLTQPARLVDPAQWAYWQGYRSAVVSGVTAKFYGNGLLFGEAKQEQYLAQLASGSSTVTLYQPGPRSERLANGTGDLAAWSGGSIARLTDSLVNIVSESASFSGAEQTAFLANSGHVTCHKLVGTGSGTSYVLGLSAPTASSVYRIKLKMFCPASNNSYGNQAPNITTAFISLGTYVTSQWIQYEYLAVGWSGQIILGSAPNDVGDVWYITDASVTEEWQAPSSLGFINTETCWTTPLNNTTCDQFSLVGGATYPPAFVDTAHSAAYRGLYVGSVSATTLTLSLTSGGAAITAGANGWMLLNGGWRFTHTVATGETISVLPELPADTQNDIWVVWLGTNNSVNDAASYYAIKRILGSRRTIWMTPIPSEPLGTSNTTRNSDQCRLFLRQNMANVVDTLPYLVTKGTGTGQDAIDAANFYTPTSLRLASDNVHLSTGLGGGYDLVWRNLTAPKGRALGWW